MDGRLTDWAETFKSGSPIDRIVARSILRNQGSEFADAVIIEAPVEGQSTNTATAVTLIGPTSSATRQLEAMESEAWVLSELNYWYQEASGGTITAAIHAATLKLLIGGKLYRRYPPFALNRFARGDGALRFGALKLNIIVPAKADVQLIMTPPNTGASSFNLYTSLMLRAEPRELMVLAGLEKGTSRA